MGSDDANASADAVKNQVARDFKNKVADEKNSGAATVDGAENTWIDAEDLLQMELGKADIDAVDICDHVGKKENRH